jgi:hypothetical protein
MPMTGFLAGKRQIPVKTAKLALFGRAAVPRRDA